MAIIKSINGITLKNTKITQHEIEQDEKARQDRKDRRRKKNCQHEKGITALGKCVSCLERLYS